MNLIRHCQQACINLTSAKLRSFLAILGILVGTAAVVALINCGQLATEKALAQFKALGTDLLAISIYQKEASHGEVPHLSIDYWRRLPEQIPSIAKIAPYSNTFQSMIFRGTTLNGAIIGADESLADIIHIHLQRGHFVSFVDTYEHYCVIGDDIAKQMKAINFEDPMGQQIQLGHQVYTIIGIASPWSENAFFNEDINQAVIIPIAGMPMLSQSAKVDNAVLLLKPNTNIEVLTEQVKTVIGKEAPKLSIFIRSAKQIIASMQSQGQIFTMLLAVIGSISLLVGGIGVMNVMLVSVSERKKEIGLRKAIGAKNRDIQTLFLVESVMLSLLGGSLGVILGLVFTYGVAYFNQWPFAIYLLPPLVGFGVSVATGIFFGFYPARRASLLEPMECLRAAF